MSKPREDLGVEALVGTLREGVEEMQTAPRHRIALRLTLAVLAQRLGLAVAPWFLSRKFVRSRSFAVAVALPLGVLLGASGHAALQQRGVAEPRELAAFLGAKAVRLAVSASVAAEPTPHAALVPTPPLPQAAVSQRLPAPARRVFAARDTLAPNRELSQLEKARTLLSEGHVAATLVQVRKHAMNYPRSALEQERQALYIKALVAADRMIEARVRAADFVRRFPNSTLRGSVEKTVASIP